jgi:ubiquinone/menaquinone biosynthesis C-methylase UbiE
MQRTGNKPKWAAVREDYSKASLMHHLQDKPGMLRSVFQVLRPGGRLAIYGLCPQESHRRQVKRRLTKRGCNIFRH